MMDAIVATIFDGMRVICQKLDILLFYTEPSKSALAQPLPKGLPATDRAYP
jgi:hypothetical protein